VALSAATRPSDFELKMRTFKRRTSQVAAADVAKADASGGGNSAGFNTGSGMDFLNGQ